MAETEKLTSVPLSHSLGDGTLGHLDRTVDQTRDRAGTVDLKALAFKVLQRSNLGQQRDSSGTTSVQKCPTPPSTVGQSQRTKGTTWTANDWRTFFDERAGILEFDGRHVRQEAERLALEETAKQWRVMHPMPPSAFELGCVQCGGTQDDLVPHLARDKDVFWLHPGCWIAFDNARRSEALAALRKLIPNLPESTA